MLTCHSYTAHICIIPWYIYKQLGSIKTKQASHILQYIYITHKSASTHMVNTQLLHVTKCAYKISQIFLWVFEFALAEFCAKFTKIAKFTVFACVLPVSVGKVRVVCAGWGSWAGWDGWAGWAGVMEADAWRLMLAIPLVTSAAWVPADASSSSSL